MVNAAKAMERQEKPKQHKHPHRQDSKQETVPTHLTKEPKMQMADKAVNNHPPKLKTIGTKADNGSIDNVQYEMNPFTGQRQPISFKSKQVVPPASAKIT